MRHAMHRHLNERCEIINHHVGSTRVAIRQMFNRAPNTLKCCVAKAVARVLHIQPIVATRT